MSEWINRLCARTLSDMDRSVPFPEGLKHFTELLKETVTHINQQVQRLEDLAKRIEERS